MIMKQHEFIWMANNVRAGKAVQDASGNTAITIRPNIMVVHNYKKRDQMTLVFVEDNSQYLIPTKKELEEIFRIHLENQNINEILLRYCTEKLTKIE